MSCGLDVRSMLLDSLSLSVQEDSVAVALSGGVDSHSVLFALLELGKEVTAYSFVLDGRLSMDFSKARKTADEFGIEFVPVFLPTDLTLLEAYVREAVSVYGLSGKAEIEATWPFCHLAGKLRQGALATGHFADGLFCLSKKAMIHYRGSVSLMDKSRKASFSGPYPRQVSALRRLAQPFGVAVSFPYFDAVFLRSFLGRSWLSVNSPEQKQPIRDAFPNEFSRVSLPRHTNLQKGDSGISDLFQSLTGVPRLNVGGGKSSSGIFNAIRKGRV